MYTVETSAEKLRLKLGSEYSDLNPTGSDPRLTLIKAIHKVWEHVSLNPEAELDRLVRNLHCCELCENQLRRA